MSKTKAQLRTTTRVYLDELSAADWTDPQIDEQLNYKYTEMYSSVVEVYEDYYSELIVRNIVSGQQEYPLPSLFYKDRRVELQYNIDPDGNYYRAHRMNFDQVLTRSISDNNIGSTSRPNYYLRGEYIGILPIPTIDVTNGFRMWQIKTVAPLIADTDEINIPFPDRFGALLPKAAAAELLRKGQQEEAVAAKYLLEFQEGLDKMQMELKNRKADGSPLIIDTIGDTMDFGNNYGSIITLAQ